MRLQTKNTYMYVHMLYTHVVGASVLTENFKF